MKDLVEKEGNYDKVRQMFGGRLRMITTGSAPISKEILKFYKKVLGCLIIEGYGQTETTAVAFSIYYEEEEFGHVGGPSKGTEFKLIDVSDMGYFTSNDPPRGEICVRG